MKSPLSEGSGDKPPGREWPRIPPTRRFRFIKGVECEVLFSSSPNVLGELLRVQTFEALNAYYVAPLDGLPSVKAEPRWKPKWRIPLLRHGCTMSESAKYVSDLRERENQ
jgi:hypothetical protein